MHPKTLMIAAGLAVLAAPAVSADLAASKHVPGVAGVALNVADPAKSAEFYSRILELQPGSIGPRPYPAPLFNIDLAKGQILGTLVLHDKKTAKPGVGNRGGDVARVLFRVRDAKAVCARLAEINMPCAREAHVVPNTANVSIAFAKDPDGNVIELIETPGP